MAEGQLTLLDAILEVEPLPQQRQHHSTSRTEATSNATARSRGAGDCPCNPVLNTTATTVVSFFTGRSPARPPLNDDWLALALAAGVEYREIRKGIRPVHVIPLAAANGAIPVEGAPC